MATVVTVAGKGSPLSVTEMDANFSNLNTDKLDDAPSDGTQYIRENGSWANLVADSFVETSSTKPSNPIDGQPWFSESNGVTYVYNSASDAWVAVGTSSGESGVRSLAAMESVAPFANYDTLFYDSSSSSWKSTALSSGGTNYGFIDQGTYYAAGTNFYPPILGRSSYGTLRLYKGTWLVQVHMSIGESVANGGVPYAEIRLHVDLGDGNGSVLQNPFGYPSNWGYTHTTGITLGGNYSYAGVHEATWCRLLTVSTTATISTSRYQINRTGDISAESTAIRVGDA